VHCEGRKAELESRAARHVRAVGKIEAGQEREGAGLYRANLADYDSAGIAAGNLVREIGEARMPDLIPNRKNAP